MEIHPAEELVKIRQILALIALTVGYENAYQGKEDRDWLKALLPKRESEAKDE